MFKRKSKVTEPKPTIQELISLPTEFRSKYEPTLLERKLLESSTLKRLRGFLIRLQPIALFGGTASFNIEDTFGTPYWDNGTSEIVLPLFNPVLQIPLSKLPDVEYKRDVMFRVIKGDIQSLAQFLKDLRSAELLFKDDTLFTLKTP